MSQPETESPPGPWYEGITAAQWMVLAIASAGWVFDVYEGQLFVLFKTPMLKELLGSSSKYLNLHANIAMGFFLIGGAVGGWASGCSATGSGECG